MSAASPFPRLFSPVRLGPVELANRLVFAAHLTNFAVDQTVGERHIAYYLARARGGAGLIVTEEHSTDAADWPYEKLVRGSDPAVVEGYRRLTAAVHAEGTPIFAQLNHNGGQSSGLYSRLPLAAPSAVADPLFREVPKAASLADLGKIVDGFARVARHCRDGGFDGVELQASQASILRGFLSRATNRRGDAYGGSLEHRARLLLEVVAAVRQAIGPAMALGVRLSGHEGVERGTTLDEAVAVARLVEATGAVDYLSTTLGVATATLYLVEPSMRFPPAYALPVAAAIRRAVSLPVVAVGRFTEPSEAEAALASGRCDLVGVVRGQIADPAFAAKARSGRASDIRACSSCNQACVGRVGRNHWIGCAVNPQAGHEAAPVPRPRPARRRVAVVGGGPAGLQAAATAAERGHEVTLFERAGRLGGQLPAAASAPGRGALGRVADDLAAQAVRRGVAVRLATPATAGALVDGGFDAVVLATGARPVRPAWAGPATTVVPARDVLEGGASPAGQVVVYDELGFHEATSVAELLAGRGCQVVLATNALAVAQDLDATLDAETWCRRAHELGIAEVTAVVPARVDVEADGSLVVRLVDHLTGSPRPLRCDWVVHATHQRPEASLYPALAAAGLRPVRVGDCRAPRRLEAAVLEGHRAAVAL